VQNVKLDKGHLKVVVINYFSAKKTLSLIESISKTQLRNISVSIVCADNSNNESEQHVLNAYKAEKPEQLTLIFNSENLGFGKAINQAVAESSFDRLLLINPDVVLHKGALNHLLNASFDRPNEGIWGGVTIANNSQDFRHAWREPTLLQTFSWATGLKKLIKSPPFIDNYINQDNQKSAYPVDIISGCCLLLSHEAWNHTNGFDERFFLYSEEFDLCKRARTFGYQPTVIPACTLEHEISHTSSNTTRLSLLFNAKFYYIKKHHNLIYSLNYRLMTALGALTRSVLLFVSLKPNESRSWLTIFCNCFKKIKPGKSLESPANAAN